MHRWCGCAVVLTSFVLTACQSRPTFDASWPEARPLGERLQAYRPPTQPSAEPTGQDAKMPDLGGQLTMRDAMAAALLNNPELARFGYDVRAAEARFVQAGLYPNPELSLEVENFAGYGALDGVDGAEVTLALSQTFPLGGDIERREELARQQGRLAGWDYEAARIALLAEVAGRYADVLAAQRLVGLAQESLVLTEQVAESIGRRVEAGDAPAVERTRAAVPVATAKIELRRAQRSLESARVQLALTWGSSSPSFVVVRGDLDQMADLPALKDISSLISQNPDVARWVTEIASRQAELELTRAQAVPDLTAGLGFRWFNASDDAALVAGASIPLPVFDRRQGDILAARFGIASAKNQQRAVQLRLEASLATAYARLANAYEQAVALRDSAIPPATQAYQDIRHAFDQGNISFLDVLDAELTLVDLRQQHLDALAQYHGAVAELEGLIGQPLDSVNQPRDESKEEPEPSVAE